MNYDKVMKRISSIPFEDWSEYFDRRYELSKIWGGNRYIAVLAGQLVLCRQKWGGGFSVPWKVLIDADLLSFAMMKDTQTLRDLIEAEDALWEKLQMIVKVVEL